MLMLAMIRWIGPSIETPYLVQPLVKTVNCQHEYAAAFAPMFNTFEGLEWTKEVVES